LSYGTVAKAPAFWAGKAESQIGSLP